jgi:hypothetical protein
VGRKTTPVPFNGHDFSLEHGVLGGKGNASQSVGLFPNFDRGLGDLLDVAICRYRDVLHSKMFGSKRGALCHLIFRFRCSRSLNLCRLFAAHSRNNLQSVLSKGVSLWAF